MAEPPTRGVKAASPPDADTKVKNGMGLITAAKAWCILVMFVLGSPLTVISTQAQDRPTRLDTAAARSFYEQGNAAFAQRPDSALTLYEKALDLLGGPADRPTGLDPATWRLRGSVLNNLAVALERSARLSESVRIHQQCLVAREQGQDRHGAMETYINMAVTYRKLGDTEGALDANQRALRLARELADSTGERNVLINLALIHQHLKLEDSALEYYEQAFQLTEGTDHLTDKARILNGMGGIKQRQGDHQGALQAFHASLAIRRALEDRRGIALVHYNLAHLLEELGDLRDAKAHLDSCMALRSELHDRSGSMSAHMLAARIALEEGRTSDALRHSTAGWDLARSSGNLTDTKGASLIHYRALARSGRTAEALAMLERHLADRDSSERSEGTLAALKDKYRMDIARTRLQDSLALVNERALSAERITTAEARARYQRYGLIAATLVVLLLGGMSWSIHLGRRRSDKLLLNILPAEVAAELKGKGAYRAVRHDEVTVLFTDLVQFTEHSDRMGPEELVAYVDKCFSAFDGIIERCGLEKIKTVGDAYLAVSGLPRYAPDHAQRAARAALAIVEAMRRIRAEMEQRGSPGFRIRVGMHSGPVVAGIVGVKKFQYDVWGDTVNTAARVQTASLPDRISITEATRRALGDGAQVEPRGTQELKGKGPVTLYFLNGLA